MYIRRPASPDAAAAELMHRDSISLRFSPAKRGIIPLAARLARGHMRRPNRPKEGNVKKSLEPGTVVHPHPVFVVGTYCEDGKPNIMTASWGGICCSKPPCVAVSMRKATLSYTNVRARKAFTINIPSEANVKQADYAGMVSGRDVDKFRVAGLTAVKSGKTDAPYVKEFPFALECRLIHEHEIGLHTQFIGEIVGIVADEKVLGPEGAPDIEKVRPLIWGGHGSSNYYGIGARLAEAFKAGKELAGK